MNSQDKGTKRARTQQQDIEQAPWTIFQAVSNSCSLLATPELETGRAIQIQIEVGSLGGDSSKIILDLG